MILPLLTKQQQFRNADECASWGYGAIDGQPVPRRFIETWPADAAELVLATDGYPRLEMTLEASEAYLAADLERDPLRIGSHRSTKGVGPDAVSFDDRAYVSVSCE